MPTSTWVGLIKWETRLVVLTNVGLLYFADPLKPPIDLFPVLDCQITQINPTTFKLDYTKKHVTFQCQSKAETGAWLSQIRKLQKVTIDNRDKLRQEEMTRLTMLMGGKFGNV